MSTAYVHSDSDADQSLGELRALINAGDHEILRLLARRNTLVARMARYKHANGLPLRDQERERELTEDLCLRARALGVSPELVGSVFRLILQEGLTRLKACPVEEPMNPHPERLGTAAVIPDGRPTE